ncbi:MAG: hypothetical protein LQ337_008385, partial [Flavoplaca oasis]
MRLPPPSLLFLLHLLTVVSSASNPTSFCKCICGSNNTIIPLDAPASSLHARSAFPQAGSPLDSSQLLRREDDTADAPSPPVNGDKGEGQDKAEDDKSSAGDEGNDKGKSGDGEKDETGEKKKEYRKKTCNDCNKQYCLSQGLKICEGKAMEDVWTTCFQRDSRKDEAVVFIFIFATAGLLIYAAVKPWID